MEKNKFPVVVFNLTRFFKTETLFEANYPMVLIGTKQTRHGCRNLNNNLNRKWNFVRCADIEVVLTTANLDVCFGVFAESFASQLERRLWAVINISGKPGLLLILAVQPPFIF